MPDYGSVEVSKEEVEKLVKCLRDCVSHMRTDEHSNEISRKAREKAQELLNGYQYIE